LTLYRASGAYTDCYFTDIDAAVSHSKYVQAFYATLPFKMVARGGLIREAN
jgi:hypothetical protein